MKQVRNTIFEKIILNNLQPKILFLITHVVNLLLISLLDGLSLYKALIELLPQLNHLWILRSTINIFIHEEKKKIKSAK